jgi:CRP-like cAMP-binding protein
MGNVSNVTDSNSYLVKFLSAAFPLSPELQAAVQQIVTKRNIKKKQVFVKEGEMCTTIYFIIKGLTRAYLLRNGKDITLWISIEDEFETAVEGFFNGKPAKENIEALEDCMLESIEAKDLEALSEKFPEVNIIIRQLMQEYYIGSEERALMGRLASADEKYNYMIEIRPHLLARVPLKYLASFLGIRLETLSRLRNKRSRRKVVDS